MTSALCRALGAAVITLTIPFAASAQESKNRVNTMTDWNVFVESNPKECWAVSAPKETVNSKDGKPTSVKRGDILLFLNYRPAKAGQIAFTGGYSFAKDSTVGLDINGKKFELITDGEWAWAKSEADDKNITAALKAGSSAVLSARSGRGTQTKDTFSLKGFTAASADAEKRCK